MAGVWALDLPTGEKIVLLSLADNANDDGHCWPSMAAIARRAGMTARGAQLIVQRLEAAGHLHRVQVPGKGCNYYIHPVSDASQVAPKAGSDAAESASSDRLTPERRSPRTSFVPNETALTPERRSPKPSRTLNKEIKASPSSPGPRARSAPPELPDGVSSEQWTAFQTVRRSIRAPISDGGKRILARLVRISADTGQPPGEMLDQSTRNGWRDVFPLRSEPRGTLDRPSDLFADGTASRPKRSLTDICLDRLAGDG